MYLDVTIGSGFIPSSFWDRRCSCLRCRASNSCMEAYMHHENSNPEPEIYPPHPHPLCRLARLPSAPAPCHGAAVASWQAHLPPAAVLRAEGLGTSRGFEGFEAYGPGLELENFGLRSCAASGGVLLKGLL